MRLLLFSLGFLALATQLEARQYNGEIDFAGNNVDLPFELALTRGKETKNVGCTNTSAKDLVISWTGNLADCSDANNDWTLVAGGSFVFDGINVAKYVCAKTEVAGAAVTGFLRCKTWWLDQPQ